MKYTAKCRPLVTLLLSLAACGTAAAYIRLQRTEGTVAVADGNRKTIPPRENLGLYSGYRVDAESKATPGLL